MSKRQREVDGDERPQKKKKKQRLDEQIEPPSIPITSKSQLLRLLAFQQDATKDIQHGVKSFKAFLESILYASDKPSTLDQRKILKEYLHAQNARPAPDSEPSALPDLLQSWSFAARGNNDVMVSSVSTVIALLIRTISNIFEFRNEGLQICRTILQKAQLRLVSDALNMHGSKAHVISPCLRLLTEIITFDGGALAKDVFKARAFTLDGKAMARNLSLWRSLGEDPEDTGRRPSVRRNAIRLLLAHLKFQFSSTKSDLLKYGDIFHALFASTKFDDGNTIKEVFDAIKIYIIQDDKILRSTKGYIWNERNLCNLASVYKQDYIPGSASTDADPQSLVHEFLIYLCGEPKAGLLRDHSGWYPPGTEKDWIEPGDNDTIDLGLASVEWSENFQSTVPVRNAMLSSFVQTLKPYSNQKECELLVKIFENAPELVADYFFKKADFNFDPKLTATWVGFASFLIHVARLPTLPYFGAKEYWLRVPPPTSIVLENIIPKPLTQRVLTRCLNQESDLITLFAARIMIVAIDKLEKVKRLYSEAATFQGALWDEACRLLQTEFYLRLPKMKDMITCFRKTPNGKALQREVLLRLLRLCLKVFPDQALEEKFDTSVSLIEALSQFQSSQIDTSSLEDKGAVSEKSPNLESIRILQLSHLLYLAQNQSDVRWWYKPENLGLSPFATLIKLLVTHGQDLPNTMSDLLSNVLKDHGVLQQSTEVPAMSALLTSLKPGDAFVPSETVYTFLDDSCARLTRRTIPYEDELQALKEETKSSGPLSLLFITLVEQWPHHCSKDGNAEIANWLARYVHVAGLIGEDTTLLEAITSKLVNSAPDKLNRILAAPCPLTVDNLIGYADKQGQDLPTRTAPSQSAQAKTFHISPSEYTSPEEDESHSGLHRWNKQDIPTAISNGALTSLIDCLSSTYPEVRHQALTNLHSFQTHLDAIKHTFENYHQFYYLTGILITTSTPLISEKPLPYLVTAYASTAIEILQDPLHPLYADVNNFHLRSPSWEVERLPSYWTHKILYAAPTLNHLTLSLREGAGNTSSSTYSVRLQFLLRYIYDALRTPDDLEIIRKRNTLEPLLALASNPLLPLDALEMLVKILWRVSWIEGGSTTMITRKGVMTWLAGRIASGRDAGSESIASVAGLKMLMRRLWETCDHERVTTWDPAMEATVARITGEEN